MKENSKKDWKLFQAKVPEWQERYMEELIKSYITLFNSPGYASDHFWELEKRIREDRKHPGVKMQLQKSEMAWDAVSLLQLGVITMDDLNEFSVDFVDTVKLILERRRDW